LDKLKLDELDGFLDELARDFNVPKPNYCVYKLVTVKKLAPFETAPCTQVRLMGSALPFDALFSYLGGLPYIVFVFKDGRRISRKTIIHEFLHYVHFLKRNCKPWESSTEHRDEEERTRKETERYWRKYRASHVAKH